MPCELWSSAVSQRSLMNTSSQAASITSRDASTGSSRASTGLNILSLSSSACLSSASCQLSLTRSKRRAVATLADLSSLCSLASYWFEFE